MNTITLRTTIHGMIKDYPLTVEPGQVMQAHSLYAGLTMTNDAYADIDAQGVNAELPLYCFHEGTDIAGTFTDYETDAVIGTWKILLNGAPADYEAVQAVVDAA